MSRVKIIGTIGPASMSDAMLRKMVKKGLSAVRINTAHVDPEYVGKVRRLVDSVNDALESHVGIMLDLKGPELRVGNFTNNEFIVSANTQYSLSDIAGSGDLALNRQGIIEKLKHGNLVKMNDGRVTFRVLDVNGNRASMVALNDGSLRSRSRVNIPGVYLDLGTVTERDLSFVKAGIENDVEFFAMSFVQSKENVIELEEQIRELGGSNGVTSKIETMKGYSDVKEIVRVSEMIMVARGDLGVELPLNELGIAQKKIIVESHKRGRPAILATQILESMVSSPEPTRAEVSDVTNAVFDNADVLMLSEETAIGKYPAEAVGYLNDISAYALRSVKELPEPEEFYGNEVSYSISRAAKISSKMIGSNGIIAFTRSGNTAKMLSALRPGADIYAVVTSGRLARKMNLLHGVIPVVIPEKYESSRDLNSMIQVLRTSKSFSAGNIFITLSGLPYFLFGGTNDLRVITMGDYLGRGYPRGKSIRGTVTWNADENADILIAEGPDFPESYKKFKGIIFRGFPTHNSLEIASSSGISVLTGAQFSSDINEREKILWDSKTGIIIRAPENQ